MHESPKDGRMDEIRKKLQGIGQDLHALREFIEHQVPQKQRRAVQKEIQRAFEAGIAYSEVQNVPDAFPVTEEGMLKIGPELRNHILESRKVYSDVDQLREVVADIFHEKTEEQLRKIMRRQERRTSGTGATEIAA